MFGPRMARTGIDLGSASVKLVRGEGSPYLSRISHLGMERWDSEETVNDPGRAADHLKKLMRRLRLSKRRLGRVAVAVPGADVSFREVSMPTLTEDELQSALPFEAKKHLNLDGMDSPIMTAQILGAAPPTDEGGAPQLRVLMAAVARSRRDYSLQVLQRLGIEPEVIDIEPLAALNELLARQPESESDGNSLALLDLGGQHTAIHITSHSGGLLSRRIGPGAPRPDDSKLPAAFIESLGERVQETLTFYRGRYRREVGSVFISGGGALIPGIADLLGPVIGMPVTILDPLLGVSHSARGLESVAEMGPCFVTAFGLCRWWDAADV